MRFLILYLGIVVLGLGCTQSVPDYIKADRTWTPQKYLWANPPGVASTRLNEHSRATQNIPIRIPEARRRPTLPERRAARKVREGVTPRRQKGPPAMIKVIALRDDKPTEAYIWINGRKAGPAPMFIHLPSGSHRIELQTSDGQKQTRELEIQPAKNQHVIFRFENYE